MNDNFYKNLIEQSPLGYAYHKIIYDETGIPCDYEFVEVNKTFEELTGMKGRDIVGKTITEVLPGITETEFDWIACYGEIALKGQKKEFEQYSEPLSKWFKVNGYSPEEGSFVTTFSDITNEQNQIDISQMKKVEHKLLESEKKLRYQNDLLEGIINNIPDVLSIQYPDHTIERYNKAGYQMLNMSHEEIKGKKCYELIGLNQVCEECATRIVLKTKKPAFIEKYIPKTGVYLDCRSTPILDEDGNIVRIIEQLRDITDSKQKEEALIQSKESKKLLLDNIQTQVWYLTNEYTYGAVNQAYADFIGLEIEDLSYKSMYEVFTADVADACRESNTGISATGKIVHTKEWMYNALGEKRLISISKTPKFRPDGSVEYVVCSADDITEQELANEKIRSSEAQLDSIVSNTPAVIYSYTIDNDGIVDLTYLNDNVSNVLGFKPEDFLGDMEFWASCVHPEDISKLQEKFTGKEMLNEYRSKDRNGKYHWILDQQRPYKKENGITEIIGTWWDITERKEMEQQIFSEREQFKTTLMSVSDGVISVDIKGNVLIMNKISEEFTGWTQEEAFGKPIEKICNIIDDISREILENPTHKVLQTGNVIDHTNNKILISENGIERNIEDSAAPIKDEQGNTVGVVLIFRDSTEKKAKEKQIEFLSYNDQLTGLYNRRYYEQEKIRLGKEKHYPLALIMADVNGLKLTNDAFGHKAGDELLQKIASILKKQCRGKDVVARIGGDEFVLLLPETNSENAEIIIDRINKATKKEEMDNIVLSISMGYAIKQQDSDCIDEVFMRAEDDMYRHKLSESASMHSKTMDLIINTLYEKNIREKLHSERVGEICKKIAEKMSFTKDKINEIKTAGLMHDIGKIGISEAILNKPDKLNTSEWEEVKRHSEIGYRILSSTEEFSQISNYVLEHHEKWDGTGYPKGLKGDEITLEARIIAVADSYDAMTEYRTYGKILSENEAIAEIKKCSGSQFDPGVVNIFVKGTLD